MWAYGDALPAEGIFNTRHLHIPERVSMALIKVQGLIAACIMKIRIHISDGPGRACLGALGTIAAAVLNRRIDLERHIGQH